jgi:hypothetical protein
MSNLSGVRIFVANQRTRNGPIFFVQIKHIFTAKCSHFTCQNTLPIRTIFNQFTCKKTPVPISNKAFNPGRHPPISLLDLYAKFNL